MKSSKKKILWSLVFLALVGLTIYAITSQSESFSFDGFLKYVSYASWQWILLAILCMLGFISCEGAAIRTLCRALGYKRNRKSAFVYSTSDIYFSAITPSATGGQPASAYFMMKDGIPGAATTIILLLNLTLYTTSIIVIGVVCFITRIGIFEHFSLLSQVMIIAGFLIQSVLLAVFILLIFKEKIVIKIATIGINILHRMHLMKNVEKRKNRLREVEKQYKECANAIKDNKKAILIAFLYNLLQRVFVILVAVCVFIAVNGGLEQVYDVFVTQGFVVIGSNSVPIPGAVGIADYLFIDGFKHLMKDVVSIELLSRGISFYSCVIICGFVTLGAYLSRGLKGMKRKKK